VINPTVIQTAQQSSTI